MKAKITLLLVILATGIQLQARQVFVNQNAGGLNNGTNWTNAYTSLKAAIDAAAYGDSIFVAAGTYKPHASNPATYFDLKNGVALFGGWAGSEAITPVTLADRDFDVNPTILSGDLNGNDNSNISTEEPTRADNSVHLFYRSNTDTLNELCIADGFTITGGNGGINNKGGAFYISGKNIRPVFRNLIIENNSAEDGGAIFVSAVANGRIYPTFYKVQFLNNRANESGSSEQATGGAIYLGGNNTNLLVNIRFTQVLFMNNSCSAHSAYGGAIYGFIRYSGAITRLTFDSCAFVSNNVAGTASNGKGGAIWMEVLDGAQAYPVFRNSLFCSNTAAGAGSYPGYGGAGHFTEGLNGSGILQPSFTNVTILNNDATGTGDAFYLDGPNCDVTLVNTIVHNDDIFLINSGSYTANFSLINTGNPRFVDPSGCDVRLKTGSDALNIGDGINGPHAGIWQEDALDLPDMVVDQASVNLGTVPVGYAGTQQSVAISATNVKNKLFVIAPAGIELSLVSGNYTGKTDTLTLSPVSGSVASTTIYYQFKPLAAGALNAPLAFSADGLTLNKPLTGTAVLNRAIYVRADATGANNGTSWTHAYTQLYDALAASIQGDTILVARGTYKPNTSSRDNKFSVKPDVKLFGSLAGNESPVSATVMQNRNFIANKTTLSGDIDNDGTLTGNSYEIVYITGGSGAIFDGFEITGANNYISNRDYTAVRCYTGAAILSNLVFTGNQNYHRGGALFLDNGTFEVNSVKFANNMVTGSSSICYGGAIYANQSTVDITHALFRNNQVKKYANVVGLIVEGGAIYANQSQLSLSNTTFYGNQEIENYGASYTDHLHNENSTVTAVNTVFADGGLYNGGSGTTSLSYCYYHGDLPAGTTNAGNNLLSLGSSFINPLFVNASGGQFELLSHSPCIQSGNPSFGQNIGVYQGAGISQPEIDVNITSLQFDTLNVGYASAIQQLVVSAAGLSDILTIEVPEGFQISLVNGQFMGETSVITLEPDGGLVADTTIYIRFSPGIPQTYNQVLTLSSPGAESLSVTLSAQALQPASLGVYGGSFTFPQQLVGEVGMPQSYSLSGNYFIEPLYLAAPEGFEISADEEFSGRTDTLVLHPNTARQIANTTIWVRFAPQMAQAYDAQIRHFSKYLSDTALLQVAGSGVNRPVLSIDPEALHFGNIFQYHNSPELSFRISGYHLLSDVQIIAPTGFALSTQPDDPSLIPQLLLTPVSGILDTTIVYVHFTAIEAGPMNTAISVNSLFVEEQLPVTAQVILPSEPLISTTPASLEFGIILPGAHASEQSTVISGVNLSGDITVAAPQGYEITLTPGDYSGNPSQVVLAHTDGTVPDQTLYVRFSPTYEGIFAGEITLNSPGAATAYVYVSGIGGDILQPLLLVTEDELHFGELAAGDVSAPQGFVLGGLNLTSDVAIDAPDGFEVSFDSIDFSGNTSHLDVYLLAGTAGADVYVRFAPQTAGSFSEVLTVTSGGLQKTIVLTGTAVIADALEETTALPAIAAYPNPVRDIVRFDMPAGLPCTRILVYDAFGRQVMQLEGNSLESADLSQFGRGVYLVRLQGIDWMQSLRIIKE